MSEITYKAFDNTEFDTESKCIAYNELPRVYITDSFHGTDTKVWVSEQDAIDYCDEHNHEDRMYAFSLHVTARIIMLPKDRASSIQMQITNTKTTMEQWWDTFNWG